MNARTETNASAGVRVEDREGVRTLWFDRPPANLITVPMLEAVQKAVIDAEKAPGVRSLLFASTLPKYFCAGIDLECLFQRPKDERIETFILLLETHRKISRFSGPTIAAIGGKALLGGWILAMACDFRWMAEENGRFALSEVKLGLSPTEVLIRRLNAIGADGSLIRELVLKGKTLKAADGLRGGCVDKLLPGAELNEAAASEARRLAKMAPQAYASIKRSIAAVGGDEEEVWSRSLAEFRRLFSGDEVAEGLAAMNEKRKPRWES